MENFGFKIIESEKSRDMRPEIAEIATQLEASEDNYSNALTDLESEDKGVREEAMIYLGRQEEYLINAADTFVRIGFDTPEERDTESAVRARLGIILEKLSTLE
ncbi:MAG: hypothetical protein M0P64_02145 [Candidatus Pacebacteria bacterium]|jgi:hypothetical protein|nr:hypothetical protein [Candidatus Paceibacterota bacterium]